MTFDAPIRNLPQVTRTLNALDQLWAVAFELALIQRSLDQNEERAHYRDEWSTEYWYAYVAPDPAPLLLSVPRPPTVKISLASPLVVELAGTLSWPLVGATALGILRYLIKHADDLGSFIPRLFSSWYNGLADAHEARERWRNRRGQPMSYSADQLAVAAQEAGQTLADAQPQAPEVTGPDTDWAPPWEEGRSE